MRANPHQIYLGRQPIVDRQRSVLAYELLYRKPDGQNAAEVGDDFMATSRVVDCAFRRLGIRTVVGPAKAFVNLGAESLMSRTVETLPPQQVVLEILETVAIDEPIIRRCRQLKAMGYLLALDDFVACSEACEPLLDIVDIVKIDILQVDPDALGELVRRLKLRPTRLLAEKVDSLERARKCFALGFDLFQGFFFSRPELLAA